MIREQLASALAHFASSAAHGPNGGAIDLEDFVPPLPSYQPLGMELLDPEDAVFFLEDAELSEQFIAAQPDRDRYEGQEPALPEIFECVDERERDNRKALAIPPGVARVIQIAGCMFDYPNLAIRKELRLSIDEARGRNRRVLVPFIMHRSLLRPTEDSCAAWRNDVARADLYAMARVDRFNWGYVDRDESGRINGRPLVAVRLTSFTDTEARVWHGIHQYVNPMDFVYFPGNSKNHLARLEGGELFGAVLSRFTTVFPYGEDARFEGLTSDEWKRLLEQMARMCAHNIVHVRWVLETGPRQEKTGHQGTSVIVGRGFDMYEDAGQYLHVSDFSPDISRDATIGLVFATANRIIERVRGGKRELRVPMYVNALHDPNKTGDTGSAILHSTDIGRKLRRHLERMKEDPQARTNFQERVRTAIGHQGVAWSSVPDAAQLWLYRDSLDSVGIVASISSVKDRRLVPMAVL